jgi:hypothetical protein
VKAASVILLCVMASACGQDLPSKEVGVVGGDRPRNLSQLLGTTANRAIIRDAASVRVCSVKIPPAGRKDSAKAPDVYRAADRGKFITLDAEHAATLKRLLLDEHSYTWNELTSFCLPNYTIRAEFTSGGNVVAANFCFGCRNLLFSKGRQSLGDQDLTTGAAAEFLRFFREVFPNDPVLGELAKRPASPGGQRD